MTRAGAFYLCLLVALLLAPVARSLLKYRRLDLFEPPVYFGILMFLGYVLPIPAFVERIDTFTLRFPTPYWPSEHSLAVALFVVCLAVAGFHAGYFFLSRLTLFPQEGPAPLWSWDRRTLLAISALYTAAGVGMFAVGVALIGGPGVLLAGLGDRLRLTAGINYFFQAINLLLVVALLWWSYYLSVERRLGSRALWAYVGFAVAMAALQGSKSILFVFLTALVLLYHLMYRRVPTLLVVLGGVVGFLFLTVYALVVREYMVLGHFVSVDWEGMGVGALVKAFQMEASGNFIQLQMLVNLVERMPEELPFQNGASYLSLLAMPIPRGIWPDKPITSPGTVTLAFWPEQWLVWGTSLPPGMVGELYLNFWTAGVAVGMTLVGFIFGRAYRAMQRSLESAAPNPAPVLLYAVLMAMLPHYIRGEAVAPTVLVAILWIPALLAFRLCLASRAGTVMQGKP